MTRWALLLLLLTGCGCTSIPTADDLRATTLILRMERGLCSGTAIGPDLILTAKHCKAGGTLLRVGDDAVTVSRMFDGKDDRLLIELTKPTFKRWAKLGKAPKQGDRVRFWGNPRGSRSWLRIGHVVSTGPGMTVMDTYACPGDSGSGIFNDAGEVVAVLSYLTLPADVPAECRFTVAQPNL